jgi:hypothetical protein
MQYSLIIVCVVSRDLPCTNHEHLSVLYDVTSKFNLTVLKVITGCVFLSNYETETEVHVRNIR